MGVTASSTTTRATFSTLHVDVARYATDDFNPFHDKHRWHRIVGNPFRGPIVLGFQLNALIENSVREHRLAQPPSTVAGCEELPFSNLQMTFSDAVMAGATVEIEVRPPGSGSASGKSSNRVIVRRDESLVAVGSASLSRDPLVQRPAFADHLPVDLELRADRSYLSPDGVFLKRKFMTTSNAKAFLAAGCIEASAYIDELEERVEFPAMFPASLLSCALIERGSSSGHDFLLAPMVYSYHKITTHLGTLAALRSNDLLHFLVSPAIPDVERLPRSRCKPGQVVHDCAAVTRTGEFLMSAEVGLVPLSSIIARPR